MASPIWNAHPELSVSDETDKLVRPIIAQRRVNAAQIDSRPSASICAPEAEQKPVIQTMAEHY